MQAPFVPSGVVRARTESSRTKVQAQTFVSMCDELLRAGRWLLLPIYVVVGLGVVIVSTAYSIMNHFRPTEDHQSCPDR